jgi:hypothetical protein
VYGVKNICDKYGKGEMLLTGNNDWSAERETFEHKCSNCGEKRMFSEKYPLIRYRTVE